MLNNIFIKKLKMGILSKVLFVGLLFMVFCCGKEESPTIAEIPASVESNAIDFEICDSLEQGVLMLDYADSTYYFTNPEVRAFVDTIDRDGISLFRKYVAIRAPIDTNRTINIRIMDIETPHSDCIPEKDYFEYNDPNFVGFDCPESTGPPGGLLCNYFVAKVEIDYGGSIGGHLARNGRLQLANCENGFITGKFENTFFQNGRFCRLLIP
jgi:hypothetical protein